MVGISGCFQLLVHILCLYILSDVCIGLAWQFHGVIAGSSFSPDVCLDAEFLNAFVKGSKRAFPLATHGNSHGGVQSRPGELGRDGQNKF